MSAHETTQEMMDRHAAEANAWSAQNIADGGVCDFCCAEQTEQGFAFVTYTTDSEISEVMVGISADGVGTIEHVNDRYWAACPACDPVIQDGDPVTLATHVAETANYDRIGIERDPSEVARLTRLYRQFFARNPVRGDTPPPYVNDPTDPRGPSPTPERD
jgi:hypothetical protein